MEVEEEMEGALPKKYDIPITSPSIGAFLVDGLVSWSSKSIMNCTVRQHNRKHIHTDAE